MLISEKAKSLAVIIVVYFLGEIQCFMACLFLQETSAIFHLTCSIQDFTYTVSLRFPSALVAFPLGIGNMRPSQAFLRPSQAFLRKQEYQNR